ncbi:phospholipase-like protein [Tanacetum coccineum]
MMTYNLNGFVWALKIWILEIYPKSTLWWVKQPDVIPRGLAWSNFNRFQKTDYNHLFGQDSIPNLVLIPTSGELKADWLVRSQYYFKGENAPFIQSVKPKSIDFQRCESKDVDYVNDVEEDSTLVEQSKKPSCSTPVQATHVLGNMKGMVDQLKSKVIDTLTSTFVSDVHKHAEVAESEVVNCETNLVERPLVEKDVGVFGVAVDICDMNLVDCPVVEKENSEPKQCSFTDTQPSSMEHLFNACAFVSPPLPIFDSPKAHKCVEPTEDTNDTDDDFMDNEDNPSQYCLDNMEIGIEEDSHNGELTVSLYDEPHKETAKCSEHTEKMGSRGQDKQLANENSDFDTLLKLQMIKASEVNVVKGDGKPVLAEVYENIRRIKKPGIFKRYSYMQQRPTTPQVKKKRKRFNSLSSIEFLVTPPFEVDCSQQTLPPFKDFYFQVLRRHCKSNPRKVIVLTFMKSFLRNGVRPKQLYKFSWVNYGIIVDEHFWLALLGLDENKSGWMLDDVALGELELWTGVITVYDSMTPRKRNKKLSIQENITWWIKMRATITEQLPLYLHRLGVLKSKGLDVSVYKIKFQFLEKVPFQANVYGDCGVWVCILLFGLTQGLPLFFGDPLQTALAYRERMLGYYWKHKVSYYHHDDHIE